MSDTRETCVGQILHEGQWLDYARGTERESRLWQLRDPENRRVVDWIDKRKVLIPAKPAPRAWSYDELHKAITADEERDDTAGYYYAWGRLDQGHPAVARQKDAESEPSGTSTSWLFGSMWMQGQREMRDRDHERRHLPSIERAWENFVETAGHSIDDLRDRPVSG